MTLKGIIALILRYFTEIDRWEADYVTVVEGRPKVRCRISSSSYDFGQN